jgi:uncharacterized membrane protein YfhO
VGNELRHYFNEEKVVIKNYKADEVALNVTMKSPGLLVLSDLFCPGWQVYVNDQKKEMLNVDYILRGVFLEPGQHTVRFSYEPSVLKYGLYFSMLFFIIMIVLAYYFLGEKDNSETLNAV